MTAIPILDVEKLSVRFRTRNGMVTALEEVSLSVAKGEMVGVVGESGSGKSVTAYTVMGLLDDAGEIAGGGARFDGETLTGISESALRDIRGRDVSMIFQNPRGALNPVRPIGKQIEDVLLRHNQATRQTARVKAVAMLKAVRIREAERRYWAYPFELSGGMCQRAMIAMALACRPRLLVADEPTTGLDVTTQKATMDLIVELIRERAMSAILITHDLGLAAQYCDRIVVMQKGRVVEQAPVAELFANPTHPYTKKLIAASPGPHSCLADLTDTPEPAEAETLPARPAMDQILLDVSSLVKEYPLKDKHKTSFRAVDGISFVLRKGESLGLVGESGCGKSTTSSMITRLLDPSAGSIFFDGEDIGALPADKFARSPLRARIQMVFQDAGDSLNPRWPVADCIAEPLRRLKGIGSKAELEQRVGQAADMVGLPRALLHRFPHQLSGGQKARVGIARAITVEPDLLVLDEPTSALDVSVQAVVLQLLDRLRRQLGMAYIFVSHDLNVVRLLCDRVIVMNGGRIVEQGPTEQVLSDPQAEYTRALLSAVPHVPGKNR